MAYTLYGIPNCDTVKKAKTWLENNGVDYTFFNFKKEELNPQKIEQWYAECGFETIVNKRGTTYKKLTDAEKESLVDVKTAKSIIQANTSIIKRPVLEKDNVAIHVGFKAEDYQKLFS